MIGAYKKVKLLGAGTLGVVWLVEDRDTGKLYAAKLISVDPAKHQALAHDISLMRKLKSSCFVEHIADFKSEGSHVIVMEYCAGSCTLNFRREFEEGDSQPRREGVSNSRRQDKSLHSRGKYRSELASLQEHPARQNQTGKPPARPRTTCENR